MKKKIILLLIIGSIFSLVGIYSLKNQYPYYAQGITVEGTIVNVLERIQGTSKYTI